MQRRELCLRLWQTETRRQTAVDKPSLRKTNFHSRCHGSSIFCCLEDAIFRRIQTHVGVTVWEDKWCSSLSFPSHQWHLCASATTEGKLLKSCMCGFGKCFVRRGRESSVSVCCRRRRRCCGIQISADAIHSKGLSAYVSQFIFTNPCVYLCKGVGKTSTGQCSRFCKNTFQVHI